MKSDVVKNGQGADGLYVKPTQLWPYFKILDCSKGRT